MRFVAACLIRGLWRRRADPIWLVWLAAGDEGKVGLLRRLVPGAAPPERLVLFEADLFDAASFAPAIAGCQFVFLVANPSAHEAAASKVSQTETQTQTENSGTSICHLRL